MRLALVTMLMLIMLTIVSCGTWFGLLESDDSDGRVEEPDDEYLPGPNEFVAVEVLPVMTFRAVPEYPPLAYQAGKAGVVWVQALVDKRGVVRDARVGRSSGTQALDEAAVRSAYLCRYTPAFQNGRPVACWVTYKVQFIMGG